MPAGLSVTHPSLGTGKDTLKGLPYQEEQIRKCQHDIHQCKDEECFHRISLYITYEVTPYLVSFFRFWRE